LTLSFWINDPSYEAILQKIPPIFLVKLYNLHG
jgi:hypothetical protein